MQDILILSLGGLFVVVMITAAIAISAITDKHLWSGNTDDFSILIIIKIILKSAIAPILILVSILIIIFVVKLIEPYIQALEIRNILNNNMSFLSHFGEFAALVWFLLKSFVGIKNQLIRWGNAKNNYQITILANVVMNGFKVIIAIILLNLLLPSMQLTQYYFLIAEKILSIVLIASITWIILQIINAIELIAIQKYESKVSESFKARGIYTQIHILKKISVILVALISIALILMIFDGVRELGTSILASAGLATAIIGFAGQKSLASILGGFQLALTQPIRIQDQVLVDGEFGEIEEITLTYVVIKLWDLRRLIVPVNYFIEKSFQNWTRTSKDLLVTIFFYFDYTLPIEPLREELTKILSHSIFWNKKLVQLQVTDAKESTMEIRVLCSADDTSSAWNLKCEIREKLITFVREKYPQSLPRTRADIVPMSGHSST